MLLVQLGHAVVAPCKGIPHLSSVVGATSLRELFVLHEKENIHNKHAMVVYLPQEIAETCFFFTKHDGQMIGDVMGH